MPIIKAQFAEHFCSHLQSRNLNPLLLHGDAYAVLAQLPCDSVDCCMTSPPYWGKRHYANGGLGLEGEYQEFVATLLAVFGELKRVLKPGGSFWLNIGDTYANKSLVGIPWRVALALIDEQGWTLRNDVIWHKVKGGPDNTTDRLRNVHENIFHFVKDAQGYYYDIDAIRSDPKKTKVVNGAIVSATGVTGVRYKRQIELSTALSDAEKKNAFAALEQMLQTVSAGEIADFRMIIRKQQRTTHSDSTGVSGRARELGEKGFYFLKYHPNGSKPSDVWEIIPEDTQNRTQHYAPYPEDICRIPILATCPPDGVVLDPFCGTGTTLLVAKQLDRQSVGIDISEEYLQISYQRTHSLL
ncbi:MAG: site-specific DNA-methyltransferase [Chloroflexi bacterium]|nr:MAG: site-specific DNA-methyltransferase [Chloroflexota bacterium]